MGCDGALIGFAGTATARAHRRCTRAVVGAATSTRAFAIWARLGPLARYCWRAPIRDYRPRMKEVLKLQGLIPHATVRAAAARRSTTPSARSSRGSRGTPA